MSYLEKTSVCAVLLCVCAGFRNGKHRLSANKNNENNKNNTNDDDRVRGGKLEWEQIHRKKASLPSSLVLRLYGANAQFHTAAASSIKEPFIEFLAEWERTERRGEHAGENKLNERAADALHQARRNRSLSARVCV